MFALAAVAAADDSFYDARLASGKQAYVEKRMPDAAVDLRIAAFGFLERPALLSETLVWLTLAESASGRQEQLRWALTRFIEVETRFHPYKQLQIDPASRTAFQKVLLATLPADTIASIPTLSDLIPPSPRRGPEAREAAKPAAPPAVDVIPADRKNVPAQRGRGAAAPQPKASAQPPATVQKVPAAPATTQAAGPIVPAAQPAATTASSSSNSAPARAQTTAPAPAQKSTPPPAPVQAPAQTPAQAPGQASTPIIPAAQPAAPSPSPAPSAPSTSSAAQTTTALPSVVPRGDSEGSASDADSIEKAKDLLGRNKNDEAFSLLRELVGRAPSRTARKYLLHAATRTHNWQTAAAQIPLVQPFKTGEEVTMFYAAVALYQTGKTAEARPLLEKSLPGINPSPYVDSYKQKIMGH
jgi:hypothetical protein